MIRASRVGWRAANRRAYRGNRLWDAKMGQDLGQVERHIGQRLRQQRESHGLSQEELSDRLGVSVAALNLFEEGIKRIPPQRLILAAEIFKVSIGWFFEDAPLPLVTPEASRTSAEIVRFLSMPESYALVSAFVAIASSDRRRNIVEYARLVEKATRLQTASDLTGWSDVVPDATPTLPQSVEGRKRVLRATPRSA